MALVQAEADGQRLWPYRQKTHTSELPAQARLDRATRPHGRGLQRLHLRCGDAPDIG